MKELSNHLSSTPWLYKNLIYLTVVGSIGYGTNVVSSDTDYRGIFIPPKEVLYSFHNNFDYFEKSEPDIAIFSLKKFFNLAVNCNPNIIEILFSDSKDHVFVSSLGQKLIDNRNLFLSKKLKFSFGGYAVSQIKRLSKQTYNNPKAYKHAMHLIRLLKMSKEILDTGEVLVKRPDAQELLEIRAGKLSYEELLEWVDNQEKLIEFSFKNSSLPHSPNMPILDELFQNIIEQHLSAARAVPTLDM